MQKKIVLPLVQLVSALGKILLDLDLTAGLEQLYKPQYVKVLAVNTNFTLLWDWNNQINYGAKFTAEYMSGHMLSWQAVPGCEHVMVTKCNLPVEIFDIFEEYSIRVKADNGSRVSFSQSVSFAPLLNSVVGPPPVIVTAKSSIIEIFIADPEEGNAKRIWDPLDYFYIVEYWTKNCEQKRQLSSKVPNITLYDLEPKTQYCLRAKVCNTRCSRNEYFSPDYCLLTTDRAPGEIPYPTNLQVTGINTNFTVTWDYDNRSADNITFTVQYILGHDRVYTNARKLQKWRTIEACRNLTETECNFCWVREIFMGIYYLRVTAIKKGVEPSYSKVVEFTPDKHTRLGAPSAVVVRSRDGLLDIQITEPRNHENKSMTEFLSGPYKYYIVFWKEGSSVNKSEITEQTKWAITDLEPWTSYCMKVQAVDVYNKKGLFSSVQCVKTTDNGYPSVWKILLYLGISAVSSFVVIMVSILFFYYLYKMIRYTFFPSSKLPTSIEECFMDHSKRKQFLILQTKEESEQCCETVSITVAESEEKTDTSKDKAEPISTQANRDSGNYSSEG